MVVYQLILGFMGVQTDYGIFRTLDAAYKAKEDLRATFPFASTEIREREVNE